MQNVFLTVAWQLIPVTASRPDQLHCGPPQLSSMASLKQHCTLGNTKNHVTCCPYLCCTKPLATLDTFFCASFLADINQSPFARRQSSVVHPEKLATRLRNIHMQYLFRQRSISETTVNSVPKYF